MFKKTVSSLSIMALRHKSRKKNIETSNSHKHLSSQHRSNCCIVSLQKLKLQCNNKLLLGMNTAVKILLPTLHRTKRGCKALCSGTRTDRDAVHQEDCYYHRNECFLWSGLLKCDHAQPAGITFTLENST